MAVKRTLRTTVPTRTVLEGGGFPVRRPIPMSALTSPFLLLDEMGPVNWPPSAAIGAPNHPHRGFETVTYLLRGRMNHADSAGNSGELNQGDVQWMTAGRGVIHSELPHPDFYKTGGVMHGFQIWVNLPAADKMMQPRYQDVPAQDIPVVNSQDELVTVRIIAGQSLDKSAVIDTVIPITFLHMTLKPGGKFVQSIEKGLNGMIYCFSGSLSIDQKTLNDGQLGILSDGDEVHLSVNDSAKEDVNILFLAGPQIDEPIARYGPFVMNTEQEIMQAYADYNAGTLA
ncbi:MAG: pirin family protein [Candidatus Poseidoniaceae archaeon]|nr:pirin family protein [Candidatus Poseidoniaceae archaeon]